MGSRAADASELYKRASSALADAWRQTRPGVAVSPEGYVAHLCDNLIPGVVPASFEPDLSKGSGHELDHKFLATYSSSALVVNTFARWKPPTELAHLTLAGHVGFNSLQFEHQCSTGLRGGPATLDVVFEGTHEVLAVESKLLEPLTPKAAKFSPSYDSLAEPYGGSNWRRLIDELRAEPERQWHLDVAQLVKHCLGLSNMHKGRWITLLYLYWTPINVADLAVYQQHSREIAELTDKVAGDNVRFQAMSYADLWADWSGHTQPPWLPSHLGHLLDRYSVAI